MTLLTLGSEHHLISARLTFPESGEPQLTVLQTLDVGAMPSFVAFAKGKNRVAAIAEGADLVLLLEIDQEGRLRKLAEAPCPGGPAYVSWDPSESRVLTASYGSGEVRCYRASDGGLTLESTLETGKYTHCVLASPEQPNQQIRLFCPSKGTDSLALVGLDKSDGSLRLIERLPAPVGTGPRHLVFCTTQNRAYLACENDTSLIVYSTEGGGLSSLSHQSSLPRAPVDGDSGADVHLTEDGRFVYMSNRGHDSIAAFERTESGTKLRFHVSTRGQVPRNFCLLSGMLIVANQESKNLTVFSRDMATGTLDYRGTVTTPERPFWVGSAASW